MSGIKRYWGLVALAVLVTAWWTLNAGPAALLVLSGLVAVWALFQAPAWCGAVNRGGRTFCRDNSRGILLGCHRREHKWQKFKLLFVSRRWRVFSRGLWASPSAKLATISGVVGTVSAFATPLADQIK